MPDPTDEFKHCNHHHELTDNHKVVDFGNGEFVANVEAIPLLTALNNLGLKTRTHHVNNGDPGFISILIDDGLTIEIREINEIHADRTKYNGQHELLLSWPMTQSD